MCQNCFPGSFLLLQHLSLAQTCTYCSFKRGVHIFASVLSSGELCDVNRSMDQGSHLCRVHNPSVCSTPKSWTTSLAITKVQIIPCAEEKPVLGDSWWTGFQHIILGFVQPKPTKRAWTWVEMKFTVQYSGWRVSTHKCFWLWPAVAHGCMPACKQHE